MKTFFHILAIIYFSINVINAQIDNNENMEKAGTAAAQFLKIPFDSRGSAMGNTGVSLPGGIGSIFWNPAILASIEKNEFGVLNANWFASIRLDYFGLAIANSRFGVVGLSILSLSTPEDNVTTIYQPEGTGEKWSALDLSIALSYGKKLSDDFSIGGSFKFIQQKIWHASAHTIAGDIGVLFTTPFKQARIGASLSNYGGKMKLSGRDQKLSVDPDPNNQGNVEFINAIYETDYFALPLLFRVGISNELIQNNTFKVTYCLDALYPSDGIEYLNAGLEATFLKKYNLRIGLPSFTYDNSIENLTLGLGLAQNIPNGNSKIGFDYSLSDFGPLGTVQKIFLNIKF